ncbi:MAG: folate-binding protein [Rhodospirillales bacterium]
MTAPAWTRLEDRGVIAVRGEDSRSFLQGIVSNDMNKVSATRAAWGAFLTPQGKYLFDFFMVFDGDTLLIETERARLAEFVKRLTLYKLRGKVDLADVSNDYAVFAVFGDGTPSALGLDDERGAAAARDGGVAFVDPRLADAGARLILPASGSGETFASLQAADAGAYDRLRLRLGLPDGSRDLIVDKSTLMENGFDELGGIDWHKGCYMGQEVTARTKHRGLVKKRLMPVEIEGDAPDAGTPVTIGDREVGELRSSNGDIGLAILRLDALDGDPVLSAGGASLHPRRPDWASF